MSITIYGPDEQSVTTIDFQTIQDGWLGEVQDVFGSADRVGLIAPTCAAAIGFWKAVVLAGKTPIMLQYPTTKLSRSYWRREVGAAVETLGVQAIAYWGPRADPKLAIPQLDLSVGPKGGGAKVVRPFADGTLAQLSSGTTGHRKGVRLTIADVADHVAAYNQVLKLGADDCVVSWLPLYHDMGFIATFLMPVMLDVDLVLIDPVAWVSRPAALFELIERHHGTVSFMPNFGFELMARHARRREYDLSSMRQWVSCSEPTRIGSMERFVEATGTDSARVANCYAMAENIFAVTQSAGLKSKTLDGADVVSCGPAVPGVSLKIVDGEVWVRSAYSLRNYEGGSEIVDREGYYPTGDLGELIDGELFILGRKHDVMIHAGRKIILSDTDYDVGRLIPESAGRISTVSAYNELLGTDEAVCLVEDNRYWAKNRATETLATVRREAGLEQGRVEYVAPGFITKTSSGKINRKITAEHWVRANARRKRGRQLTSGRIDNLQTEIGEMFPGLVANLPFEQQLDSLGLINLSMLLEEFGFDYDTSTSLSTIQQSNRLTKSAGSGPVINVVSLFDFDRLGRIVMPAFSAFSEQTGVSIHYEHVCCPPAPILLSDLTFEDQFSVRDDRKNVYDSLSYALEKVRDADLILIDDMVQLAWPASTRMQYPRINHRFEATPRSADLAVRWQRYSEHNHLIAADLIESEDVTRESINSAIDELEDYLGIPIVRIGITQEFAPETAGWQVRVPTGSGAGMIARPLDYSIDEGAITQALYRALINIRSEIKVRQAVSGHSWKTNDLAHWCSWLVNRDLIDFVLDGYESFLVLGKIGSVPYLAREASRRGKRLLLRPDLFCPPGDDYECVLMAGAWGEPATEKPVFPLMLAGWGNDPRNVSHSIAGRAPPNMLHPLYRGAAAELLEPGTVR